MCIRDRTGIDPVSLIAFDKVVMTADAVKQAVSYTHLTLPTKA
ncbi:hypothetical protein JMUB7529_28230 [Staphylococcus aureus]